MVEKAGDVEANTNLQLPSYVQEINSRYPKGHCLLPKKIKRTHNGSTAMRFLRIGEKLNLIPLLSLISLKTPENIMEIDEEIVQPPGFMLPKKSRRRRTRLKT